MWEQAPKTSSWQAIERFFDEIHPVLAEEQLVAHDGDHHIPASVIWP